MNPRTNYPKEHTVLHSNMYNQGNFYKGNPCIQGEVELNKFHKLAINLEYLKIKDSFFIYMIPYKLN